MAKWFVNLNYEARIGRANHFCICWGFWGQLLWFKIFDTILYLNIIWYINVSYKNVCEVKIKILETNIFGEEDCGCEDDGQVVHVHLGVVVVDFVENVEKFVEHFDVGFGQQLYE